MSFGALKRIAVLFFEERGTEFWVWPGMQIGQAFVSSFPGRGIVLERKLERDLNSLIRARGDVQLGFWEMFGC